MMKNIFQLVLLALMVNTVLADDRPRATLKAEYEAWHDVCDHKIKDTYHSVDKYVLQIGDGLSYYYDPQTFFMDSLENDPVGGPALRKLQEDLSREYVDQHQRGLKPKEPYNILKEKGLTRNSRFKLLKDFRQQKITVWDSSFGTYQYPVEMDELRWEICDSTENVLGYECNLARANYHGRKWEAWFTPEVPVQDGPWQLCGLPGLILKAKTEDGEYGFTATGLQKCDEPFKKTYINEDKVFKSKRKSFLKIKDNTRRNRGAFVSAMTNGAVNRSDINYTGTDDFIETDYHD